MSIRWLLEAIAQFSSPPPEEPALRSEFMDEVGVALAHVIERAPQVVLCLASSANGPMFFYQWDHDGPHTEVLGPAARFLRFRETGAEPVPSSRIPLLRGMRLLPAGGPQELATRPTNDLDIARLGAAVGNQPLLVPRIAPLAPPQRWRWKHVLGHLARSQGAVTLRVRRRRSPLSHEADYVRMISELDHSCRSGPATEETWRERNPLFWALLDAPTIYEIEFRFDGEDPEGLYAAIAADTGFHSFTTDELAGHRPPYRDTDPREVVEQLNRMRSLYTHSELIELLMPPFSFAHSLSSQKHFTPAPFVLPAVPAPRSERHMLIIGHLPNGQLVLVPVDFLPRGVFVTGTTGSGKTVTAQSLVVQTENTGIPITIVDPIKSEWRKIEAELKGPLRILDFSPESFLMVNPFIPAPNMNVAGYIEPLAGILSMTGPTNPVAREYISYIVRHLYETALGVSADALLTITGADLMADPHRAPTFDDFLTKGPEIVAELVSGESSQNARETLEYFGRRAQTIKGSLLHAIFTPPADIPAQSLFGLFAENTLIELVRIPDELQRTAIYALIALQLTHYRLTTPNPSGGLQHLVVLEECHNVLGTDYQRYDAKLGQSPAEVAVRLLKSQLAELRAAGQGLLLIDQSSARIVPDALINTSTRLVHNVSFGEDRKALGIAMGLSPAQERYLNRLDVGQAIVGTPDLPPCEVAVKKFV